MLCSSVPCTRRKGKSALQTSSEDRDVSMALVKDSPIVLTQAHGDDDVACLYIDAWIGKKLVEDVLVDGGAMLDLISEDVANKLKLEKHVVRGLGMRLADDSLVCLNHYVWADIIVAGVVARVKVYVVPVSVTYKVLLSRRWLKRVRGIEYHETNVLYIEGMDGVQREVRGKPATKQEVEIVKILPEADGAMEVETEEAEDAIEVLLHELDHWQDQEDGDGVVESGN